MDNGDLSKETAQIWDYFENGNRAFSAGKYDVARKVYQSAIQVGEQHVDDDLRIELRETLGFCCYKLKRFEEAKRYDRETLDLVVQRRKSNPSPELWQTSIRLRHNLARDLSALYGQSSNLNCLGEAVNLYRENLRELERSENTVDPFVKTHLEETQYSLAVDLAKLGKATKDEQAAQRLFEEAVSLNRKVVRVREKNAQQQSDRRVIIAKHNYATALYHLKRYRDARSVFLQNKAAFSVLSPADAKAVAAIVQSTDTYLAKNEDASPGVQGQQPISVRRDEEKPSTRSPNVEPEIKTQVTKTPALTTRNSAPRSDVATLSPAVEKVQRSRSVDGRSREAPSRNLAKQQAVSVPERGQSQPSSADAREERLLTPERTFLAKTPVDTSKRQHQSHRSSGPASADTTLSPPPSRMQRRKSINGPVDDSSTKKAPSTYSQTQAFSPRELSSSIDEGPLHVKSIRNGNRDQSDQVGSDTLASNKQARQTAQPSYTNLLAEPAMTSPPKRRSHSTGAASTHESKQSSENSTRQESQNNVATASSSEKAQSQSKEDYGESLQSTHNFKTFYKLESRESMRRKLSGWQSPNVALETDVQNKRLNPKTPKLDNIAQVANKIAIESSKPVVSGPGKVESQSSRETSTTSKTARPSSRSTLRPGGDHTSSPKPPRSPSNSAKADDNNESRAKDDKHQKDQSQPEQSMSATDVPSQRVSMPSSQENINQARPRRSRRSPSSRPDSDPNHRSPSKTDNNWKGQSASEQGAPAAGVPPDPFSILFPKKNIKEDDRSLSEPSSEAPLRPPVIAQPASISQETLTAATPPGAFPAEDEAPPSAPASVQSRSENTPHLQPPAGIMGLMNTWMQKTSFASQLKPSGTEPVLSFETELPTSEEQQQQTPAPDSGAPPIFPLTGQTTAVTTEDLPARTLDAEQATTPLTPPEPIQRSRSVNEPMGGDTSQTQQAAFARVNAPGTHSNNTVSGDARAHFGNSFAQHCEEHLRKYLTMMQFMLTFFVAVGTQINNYNYPPELVELLGRLLQVPTPPTPPQPPL